MPDDRLSIVPLPFLTKLFLDQLENGEVFGIPEELFFHPEKEDPFRIKHFGQLLETPVGVAAGPHTQMAQNIVMAWLCGARFIELKTIQTLDELDVSKPCIDMQDEGYNCEWSQELKIHESYDQYLNAWILIHLLKHKSGWDGNRKLGTIFNMSIGYNLEGILKDNVQWFLEKMRDCSIELNQKKAEIEHLYPEIHTIRIPSLISDNVTLSTMHGCPPDEIEKIGEYLIREKKLHTVIKLNPTLLGPERLRQILNKDLGYETHVPDEAFAHDLKFKDALAIIRSLQKTAAATGVDFGIKLSNTRECVNHKDIFPAKENMMYMSGKALHPITINLAAKLQSVFDGQLNISFSGGADCFNIAKLITCNLQPVTICSDLLKPGGYGRLNQYINNIKESIHIQTYAKPDVLTNLLKYADHTVLNKTYACQSFNIPDIKTDRKLLPFDCIHAPCIDTCPTHQDIPGYMYHTSRGDVDNAFQTILDTNPFPSVTGMVCDHLCQLKCTRINYDESLLIREIKRYAAENHTGETTPGKSLTTMGKAGIIGAGPCGLSAAYFLNRAGFEVEVHEEKDRPGGMVTGAIPAFRLTDEAILKDIQRIENSGVKIHYNKSISTNFFRHIQAKNNVVFIATGAQRSKTLVIDGIDSKGVLDPLQFLFDVKRKKQINIGSYVVIIGGGNTAMDAARTASRLVGNKGKVTIIYRRTRKEMPADLGEINAVMEEGVEIIELLSPLKINKINDRVQSILCQKMELSSPDSSGRPRPVPIAGAEIKITCDTVIPAIGQDLAIDFVDHALLKTDPGSYQTRIPGVYIGGDAMRGASTAINAIGDGRKAVKEILEKQDLLNKKEFYPKKDISIKEIKLKRYHREEAVKPTETQLDDRKNFNLVVSSLNRDEAIKESSRCMLCDELCNVCVSVCPNLANWSYEVKPGTILLKKIVKNGNRYILEDDDPFVISQKYQVLNIADWCNECGNCTTFCPSSGAPYKDKPRIHLTKESFERSGSGFFIEKNGNGLAIIKKNDNNIAKLSLMNGKYIFKNHHIKLNLNEDLTVINFDILDQGPEEVILKDVAEMKILLHSFKFS